MSPSPATHDDGAPPTGAPFARWRVFLPVGLGVIMATLDISVVNIALPTLQRAFVAPLTSVEWVVLAYVGTITGLLLAFGRLADALGRRRVYATGLVLFVAASASCGAAPGLPWLIASRVAQGVGAAMMSATSSALLVSAFPPEERGRALGAFGAMVGVGLALGPPLGGLIVGHASWRWIFFVNLPLGLLALALLLSRVPADAPATARRPLDALGVLAWCAALAALMLALSRGPNVGWLRVAPLFVAALVMLATFAWREACAQAPLLPARELGGPLGVALCLTLLSQVLSVAVGFHLPLYLEDVLGFDAARSGRWLATLPLAALFCAPLAGRLADRVGTRPLSVIGLALTAVGLGSLSFVGVEPHPVHILGGMILVGVGQGLFAVPNSAALLSFVPPERLGVASGLQATARNLGLASGAAVMAALVASRYVAHGGHALGAVRAGDVVPAPFAAATHDAYVAMAGVAVIALLLAARQPEPVRRVDG